MSISGIIDNIIFPNKVVGWAYYRDNPSLEIDVSATLNTFPVNGSSIWGHEREFHWLNNGKIGFTLSLEDDLTPDKFTTDCIKFYASASSIQIVEIPIDEGLKRFFRNLDSFSKRIVPQGFSYEDHSEMIKFISRTKVKLDTAWYEFFISAVDYSGKNFGKKLDISIGDISTIAIPKGLCSSDGSAVILKGGYGVLVGGSNDVKNLYNENSDSKDTAERWIEIIDNRRDVVVPFAQYVHTIIPEKLTCLGDLFEPKILRPGYIFSNIESHYAQKRGAYYVSVLANLNSQPQQWRKMDTHLSPRGAYNIAQTVIETVGLKRQPEPSFDSRLITVGDLSMRFLGFPIYDEADHPIDFLPTPELVFERQASRPGGHIGIQRRWQNASAPIKKRLLVVGNSFAGQAESACDLNWWFARYFENVFFDFNTELDWDLLSRLRPDIVFTQTIERFLNHVPRS